MEFESRPGVVLIVSSFKASLGSFSCESTAIGTGFLYRPDGYLITNGHVIQLEIDYDLKASKARAIYAMRCMLDAVQHQVSERLGSGLTEHNKEILQELLAKLLGRQSSPEDQTYLQQALAGLRQERPLSEDERSSLQQAVSRLIDEGRMDVTNPSLAFYLSDGTKYTGEVKAYSGPIEDGGKDIAIVKIGGTNLPTVPLGNSDDVRLGQPFTVVAYPGVTTNATVSGLFSEHAILAPTVILGRFSAVNKTDYKGTSVLESEGPIAYGSGGPAFDSNGRVIGIASVQLNGGRGNGLAVHVLIPINRAEEFVRQAGADPERGPFDALWYEAVEAYVAQHWWKAHKLMGRVLEMMPSQPDAMSLEIQAGLNIPKAPIAYWIDRLGTPVFASIIAGLILLILGVPTILLYTKPLWNLKIYRWLWLFKIANLKIPGIGNGIQLGLQVLTVFPLFIRNKRTLDAWIQAHKSEFQAAWKTSWEQTIAILRPIDGEPEIPNAKFVPLPIAVRSPEIGALEIGRPDAAEIRKFVRRERWTVQIIGLGGAGKTTRGQLVIGLCKTDLERGWQITR
jgi:S1-C subfamily serine protease